MDLREIASENARGLADRFRELEERTDDADRATVRRFAEWVDADGRVAVNMRPSVLARLVTAGKHLNVYEWADEQSAKLGGTPDDFLRARLKDWYTRRLSFDSRFSEGRAFRYGALNAGGVGTEKYGEFCAVFVSEFGVTDGDCVFVKADSLLTYMRSETDVDEDALRCDVSPHAHRHHLTALKHAGILLQTPEPRWPTMVCAGNEYIEVIFTAAIESRSIDNVRIRDRDYQGFFELVLASHEAGLSDAEKALAQDFVDILQAESSSRIRMQRVADD